MKVKNISRVIALFIVIVFSTVISNIVRADDETQADKVFYATDQMPQFPGGEGAMMKYLSAHIKYPPEAVENNVQGQVIVQFVVEKDGSIGEVKVIRSRHPELDKEAVRVVKTLPAFIPGKKNGEPVNIWYTIPVRFKAEAGKTMPQ